MNEFDAGVKLAQVIKERGALAVLRDLGFHDDDDQEIPILFLIDTETGEATGENILFCSDTCCDAFLRDDTSNTYGRSTDLLSMWDDCVCCFCGQFLDGQSEMQKRYGG